MAKFKRFKIDQLIRDKLPEFMKKQDVLVYERALDQEEFALKLREKLLIEAAEVKDADTREHLAEELADLLEVIYALVHTSGLKMDEIEEKRLKKLKARGGYDAQLYNPYVEVDESNPAIKYYLDRPKQYPLING